MRDSAPELSGLQFARVGPKRSNSSPCNLAFGLFISGLNAGAVLASSALPPLRAGVATISGMAKFAAARRVRQAAAEDHRLD
jgi:hypothetical protein